MIETSEQKKVLFETIFIKTDRPKVYFCLGTSKIKIELKKTVEINQITYGNVKINLFTDIIIRYIEIIG